MSYSVRADEISKDINDSVRTSILKILKNYSFPYVTSVTDKEKLQQIFIEYFENKKNMDWLKQSIHSISNNNRGYAAVALTESNRIHTVGLGKLLLSQGQKKCKSIHSYGDTQMSSTCRENLEDKILDIEEIIRNSLPSTVDGLRRNDIPMIPQHVNCRHVMAPIDD